MAYPRLPTPSKVVTKTIATLHAEFLTGNKLELSPSYQRARCWTQAQNCGIVNTIMRNWPMPMLTLYKLSPAIPEDAAAYAAGVRYECVDGQNRLHAIRAFLEGRSIANDKGVEEAVLWEGQDLKSAKQWRELTEEEQDWFGSYDVAVSIIQSPMPLEERKAMFTRLQDGSRINRSEYIKNTVHPVSQFTSRTGLRDLLFPALKGLMAGPTQWMDVIVDCATLWLHRDDADPLAALNRNQAELRKVLECKKAAPAGSVYDMPLTPADDAVLLPLFTALIAALQEAKGAKGVRCHKFHVALLFLQIVRAGEAPASSVVRKWFRIVSPAELATESKAGKPDNELRAILWEMLSLTLDDDGSSASEGKPKRRAIPKKKREQLWGRYFGAALSGVCQCCAAPIASDAWEQAHIVAVARGGDNELSNLVPTCVGCNRSCGAEDLREWCAREYPAAPLLQ